MKMILAQFLTLSLLEKIGMIFSLLLLLYLTKNWKSFLTPAILVFIRHIVCALLAKIIKPKYEFRKEYFTGFT
jgi:hypothetical protein